MKCDCTSQKEKDSSCGNTGIPKDLHLAEAFIPDQIYRDIMPLDVAFKKGTIFKELDLPYRQER